jgi:uncharacterized membrane protein
MNKTKISYWLVTIFIALFMLMSGFMYLSENGQVMEGMKAIGIPYSFIQILGVAKILGALALLFSKWKTLKEWAYAGFAFNFIGAIWVCYSSGETAIPPVIALALLSVSYRLWQTNSSQISG